MGAPSAMGEASTPDPRSIVLSRRRGVGGMYVYAQCPQGHEFRWRHYEGHTTAGAGAWLARHIECTEERRGGPSVFAAFSDAFESDLVQVDGSRLSGDLVGMRGRS
ncbi:hypothetical protein AB0K08_13725 [Citricoccus sp. NPDC055426]|uniref:hypothetical protein n=1 Tax=Citricoccus sp. NPDC055426 TaxID=3155536 RepID=UPI00342B947F